MPSIASERARDPKRVAKRKKPDAGYAFPLPFGQRHRDFVNPNRPTRTGPLNRLQLSPDERHALLFPHHRVHESYLFQTARERYRPDMEFTARRNPEGESDIVRRIRENLNRRRLLEARKKLQRPVLIVPGIGGVDVAMAPRYSPDIPSGRRGVYRTLPSVNVAYGPVSPGAPATAYADLARDRSKVRDVYGNPIYPSEVSTVRPGVGGGLLLGALVLGAVLLFRR